MIEDIRQDKNCVILSQLAQRFAPVMPDFVKNAAISSLEPVTMEDRRCLADKINRRFPCHSKAATYVSYLYYLTQRDHYSQAARKIVEKEFDKYASVWNIQLEMDAARELADQQLPSGDLPDEAYAFTFTVKRADGSCKVIRKVPMTNAVEVRRAAEWFADSLPKLREKLTFRKRAEIAERILNRAQEMSAALEEYESLLCRCAGIGTSAPETIADQLRRRVKLAGVEPPLKVQMEKTAMLLEKTSVFRLDPATRMELADTLDRFDHFHQLRDKYGAAIQPPEDVVFGVDVRKLGEFRKAACQLTTGSIYSVEDLSKLRASTVRQWLGDEIADEVARGMNVDGEKMAEVASTFPRPQAEIFEEILQQQGIMPIHKEAVGEGLTPAEWQNLANQ